MRSIVEKKRLDELLSMDKYLRDTRDSIRLAEAIAFESILVSRREAIKNESEGIWTHALIERFPTNKKCPSRKEIWVMFTPYDIELAKSFHSYRYWKHAILEGETVLCSMHHSSWNILCSSDVILRKVKSSKEILSEFQMNEIIKATSEKFGL